MRPLPPTIPGGGENYQGSRGSTAQRSLRKPLPLAFSWIWSCEDQKNSEATRQDGKLLAANVSNYMPQISPPGGHPANRKMPQKRQYNFDSEEIH